MTFQVLETRSFGQFNRFRIDRCQTRFGTETFLVFDSEQIDKCTGLAKCIRQADSETEALGTVELDGFALGDLVENFNQIARVFKVDRERGLFVQDVKDGQKWLAEPKFCIDAM